MEALPLETLRHSAAHILADAIKQLHPEAQLAIGPATQQGFYYDVDLPVPLSDQDLIQLESIMLEIIRAELPFEKVTLSRDEAVALFKTRNESYKLAILDSIPADQLITAYRHGDFIDLCRGPHMEHTGQVKAVKLLSVAGAYFRGDSRNKMLTRVYGTAFHSQEALQSYLKQIEEAQKRDHRKLGKELELFHFEPWAVGGTFWLPKGTQLWNILSQWMRDTLLAAGYVEVRTPLLFNQQLWETSGHWQVYKEDMFTLEAEQQGFGLKPMNCPSHMLLFRSRKRSYRELPLRLHDQGVLHRAEASGTLSGLTRVRQFCQDDGHIFITQEQITDEVTRMLKLVDQVYTAFGLQYQVKLSTRNPQKMLGEESLWDAAEAGLQAALQQTNVAYKVVMGEAAFYGPKIDFDVTDALGRNWQCATIQLDFQLPRRFELSYVGADNAEHCPVVIHRAIFGSFERFIALLIEHFAGAFPAWLSPVQLRILGVSQKHDAFVAQVDHALRRQGFRAEADLADDKLGAKIRRAQMEKIPYMLVVGDKEMDAHMVSVRLRDGQTWPMCSVEDLVLRLQSELTPPKVM